MDKSVELVKEIAALFSEKLLLNVDSADTDLVETGALDSANLVELLLHLEERFGLVLSIEELEIDHFRSLRTIADLVARRSVRLFEGCCGKPLEALRVL